MKNILLLSLCLLSLCTWAADKVKLHYAGFAFVGDAAKVQTNYPASFVASQTKDDKGDLKLDKELKTRVEKIKSDKFDLTMGLGDIKEGSALSVAFAVDWENVAVEKVADLYKFVATVNAQILVFDFKDKKIIASFPISVEVIDARQAKQFLTKDGKEPTKAELVKNKLYKDAIQGVINSIYTNTDTSKNIFDIFVKKLANLDIKQKYGYRIKVNDVAFEEKALETLKEYDVDKIFVKNFIANNFIKFLSTNQQVSVLPYNTGDVIGRKMSARFMNGEVYNLEIPKSDYDIDITVKGFKNVEYDRTASEIALAFGASFIIKVLQPELNKIYMNADFVGKASKTISINQSVADVDVWSAYQETMLSFFNEFTQQITSKDDKWLKGASKVDIKELKEQFKQLDELLQRCK